LYIYKDGVFLDTGVLQFGPVLKYLPYDNLLINKNFGINSEQDMQAYINDIISLFEEFVAEYMYEVQAGNSPD
jgi:hypothetical protein